MIQIALSPDTEAILRQRAQVHGEDAAEYAARLVRQALQHPTADELLAPLRRQVAQSGITDKEIDTLGEELRDEAWRDVRDSTVDST